MLETWQCMDHFDVFFWQLSDFVNHLVWMILYLKKNVLFVRLLVSQQVCNWTFLAVGQGFAERTVMVDSDRCQGIPAFNLLENIL